MPVNQWFNRAAPRVKSGEVDPARTDAASALALMLADPLLIRRPLMQRGAWQAAGFDAIAVDEAIGLALDRTEEESRPLEGCAHGDDARVCAVPA
jgi:nitrogenase-associated protein